MMVTFVSQCEKRALPRTRRVLDAFADRIGSTTWQTVITQDGLLAVKKLLRKTASRNTAVSCHWTRSRSRSQLLWIVGNRSKFSVRGVVPVNYTSLNLHYTKWGRGWHFNEASVLAAGIAGLFHDFGKANDLFQKKLTGETSVKSEPYRHEWVSLRLFEAFCLTDDDSAWLTRLSCILKDGQAAIAERTVLAALRNEETEFKRPLEGLAPFAKLIAWLIISHHRLPMAHVHQVNTEDIDHWLSNCFDCHWNSKNAQDLDEFDQVFVESNWRFSLGTPFLTKPWQYKASALASRALHTPYIVEPQIALDWFNQRFVSHIARLSLMLADHYYSSLPVEKSKTEWRDENYQAFANTDRRSASQNRRGLKQKLDEHNIGVSVNAQYFAQNLPSLKRTLPFVAENNLFTRNVKDTRYRWQNKAFSKAKLIAKASEELGFFGVNMASTGSGKTLANARIMYGLSDERDGCRFSVALGLRTLTLQTGDAYRQMLNLGDDELAVLIGSHAVKTLHQLSKLRGDEPYTGSESADELFDSQQSVSYEGEIYDGRLRRWLKGNPKLGQLISAPILVSTIDHLMPATESKRGGKQIAPMLRLLTSDLVLDEPDDFGLEDLPALCRLVNWAGMLGSRVLLSSATLPPALIKALFDAYKSGREHFNRAHFESIGDVPVCCGWFDEYKSETAEISSLKAFMSEHKKFTVKRAANMAVNRIMLRKGNIIDVEMLSNNSRQEQHLCLAQTIHESIHNLHDEHNVEHSSGQKVSIGVVRMANINPLVAVTKFLVNLQPRRNYCIHFCVYHSQFPLAVRSFKEGGLDRALTRHDEQQLWRQKEITDSLANAHIKHHIFVVLGTSVVEVGRDHDYDWAIAEPSSLRALVQLAGRIQRHRQLPPSSANLHVLNQNLRALNGELPAYCKPGFETLATPLARHKVSQLIDDELSDVSALSRMIEPEFTSADFEVSQVHETYQANPAKSLAVQEHRALRFYLERVRGAGQGKNIYRNFKEAELWWRHNTTWSAEFIRQTEFRRSQPEETFVLRLVEEEPLEWFQLDFTRTPMQFIPQSRRFSNAPLELAEGCHWWFSDSAEEIYHHFADLLKCSPQKASEQLGEIHLRGQSDERLHTWLWHGQLGAHESIEGEGNQWN